MVTLLLNSIAHFLVDALCVTTLFSAAEAGERLLIGVVLYNTLAFSTQCVVGLLVDRLEREKIWELASFVLVILGFALPIPFFARIVLVGLGNSVFHVAAGTVTLRRSGEAAWPLGVFVAPGAFGVTLGTLFPRFAWLLAGLMLLCGLAILLTQKETVVSAPTPQRSGRFPLAPVILLTLAVAVRALGGVAVSFPWQQTALPTFLLGRLSLRPARRGENRMADRSARGDPDRVFQRKHALIPARPAAAESYDARHALAFVSENTRCARFCVWPCRFGALAGHDRGAAGVALRPLPLAACDPDLPLRAVRDRLQREQTSI